MNATNSILHALAARGGFAPLAELKQLLPKFDVPSTSELLVTSGYAEWQSTPEGGQAIRLTEETLVTMFGNALKMTQAELCESLAQGRDFTNFAIFILRDEADAA